MPDNAGRVKQPYGDPDLKQPSLFPNDGGSHDRSKLAPPPADAPNQVDCQFRVSPGTDPRVLSPGAASTSRLSWRQLDRTR